jgi:hypothetical protein
MSDEVTMSALWWFDRHTGASLDRRRLRHTSMVRQAESLSAVQFIRVSGVGRLVLSRVNTAAERPSQDAVRNQLRGTRTQEAHKG